MAAIADIFFFFIILLVALGFWGYMAFGDRYDAYVRYTGSFTTSLSDVLGNVDYDKKPGIVPFLESTSSYNVSILWSACFVKRCHRCDDN